MSLQEGSRELESELEAQLTQAEIKNKVNSTVSSYYYVLAALGALALGAPFFFRPINMQNWTLPPPPATPLFIKLSVKGMTMRL